MPESSSQKRYTKRLLDYISSGCPQEWKGANKRFQCHICEKWFRSSGYLTQHMKACSGLKEEECAFCGKRFAKKSVLLNHERLHTGDKPFQCRICDERFRTHHNYSNHGKNAHGAQNATHYNKLQNAAEEEKKTLQI